MAPILLPPAGVGISLLDPTGRVLASSAAVLERRHTLLAANVANVETPGHVRADLDFPAMLRAVLHSLQDVEPSSMDARTSGPALAAAAAEPFVLLDDSGADLELEMAEIARNSLRLMAVSTLLSMKLEHLRTAISEGRR